MPRKAKVPAAKRDPYSTATVAAAGAVHYKPIVIPDIALIETVIPIL